MEKKDLLLWSCPVEILDDDRGSGNKGKETRLRMCLCGCVVATCSSHNPDEFDRRLHEERLFPPLFQFRDLTVFSLSLPSGLGRKRKEEEEKRRAANLVVFLEQSLVSDSGHRMADQRGSRWRRAGDARGPLSRRHRTLLPSSFFLPLLGRCLSFVARLLLAFVDVLCFSRLSFPPK